MEIIKNIIFFNDEDESVLFLKNIKIIYFHKEIGKIIISYYINGSVEGTENYLTLYFDKMSQCELEYKQIINNKIIME